MTTTTMMMMIAKEGKSSSESNRNGNRDGNKNGSDNDNAKRYYNFYIPFIYQCYRKPQPFAD